MAHGTALKLALELLVVPSRIRAVRQEPLPDDVLTLLRIAAGEDDAEREAVEASERPAKVVKEAVGFYIQQILLSPTSDSYRVLGATPTATVAELRRNMALLLRWLHPDVDPSRERSMFAARVLSAWEDLKSPERRRSYDERLAAGAAAKAVEGAERQPDGHRRRAKPGSPGRSSRSPQPVRPQKRGGLIRAALRYLRGEW